MARKKASELTERQRRGRNNKSRGSSVERSLVRWLENHGIHARRVVMSGALKKFSKYFAGDMKNFRGDVIIDSHGEQVRVEVKSRKMLPRYVTRTYTNRKTGEVLTVPDKDVIKKTKDYYILSQDEFVALVKEKRLPRLSPGNILNMETDTELDKWFAQDSAEVVAMKEYGKRTWYFAVKLTAAKNKFKGEEL